MFVSKTVKVSSTGKYSKKKRKQSDAFLYSDFTKQHVARAFLRNTRYTHADLKLIEPNRDQDINFGLDGEFYIPAKESLRVTGRMGFRCRTHDKLERCDLTITEGIKNGQPGEFHKSRANTMLYTYENEKRNPEKGFALFTVVNFFQTVSFIKAKKIYAPLTPKSRYGGDQFFYAVSFKDLYEYNLLYYVGVDEQAKSKLALSVLEDKFPEVVFRNCVESGHWSFFNPYHMEF